MTYAAAFSAIAAFVAALWLFRLVPAAANAVTLSRDAARAMRDASLSDDEKERAVQRASIGLLSSFASIAFRGLAAFAVSVLPIYAFDIAGLAPLEQTVELLETWEVILGSSVVMTAAYFIGRPR